MHKILIANRGEVALRVKRSLDRMGIASVMVYSQADRLSRHVTEADEAVCIGPGPSAESYLLQEKLIRTAMDFDCDGIHPGYGFLAENADFAERVVQAGLTFIGPRADVMRLFGSKIEARRQMMQRDVPVAPGTTDPVQDFAAVKSAAELTGYPLLIKAAGGGGGKGMRIVREPESLSHAFEQCVREAKNAFGDERVFVEKYMDHSHHIEFQVLGDKHGHAVHFGHRECSVQRRHQKLIEETPSVNVTREEEVRMGRLLCDVLKDIGYDSLGTFEFMRDEEGNYAFLEMNTRLQVEHSVTEMTWDVDLIEHQVRVAYGEKLQLSQEDLKQYGHAMECRICAEDCLNNFAPSPGLVRYFAAPDKDHLRLDWFAPAGCRIPLFYDPMIAKLTAWGEVRRATLQRMDQALAAIRIQGFPTNIPFHRMLLKHPALKAGRITTAWIGDHQNELVQQQTEHLHRLENLAAAFAAHVDAEWSEAHEKHSLFLECVNGVREVWVRRTRSECNSFVTISDAHGEDVFDCTVDWEGNFHAICQNQSLRGRRALDESGIWEIESQRVRAILHPPGTLPLRHMKGGNQALSGRIVSPINGRILKVCVQPQSEVQEGDLLLILEAMKMENEIRAPVAGVVTGMAEALSERTVGKGDFLLEIQE